MMVNGKIETGMCSISFRSHSREQLVSLVAHELAYGKAGVGVDHEAVSCERGGDGGAGWHC